MHTQRQMELIEAAIRLTAKEGIQHLTIRNVASEIGVTEAAVYRHFPSKQALLKAILDHLNTVLAPHLKRLLDAEEAPSKALSTFITDLFSLIQTNAAFTLMLFAEETFNVEPQLKGQLKGLLEGNLSYLVQFYTRAMERGECRNDLSVQQLAIVTFGTIRLSVSRWHLQESSTPLLSEVQPIQKSLVTLLSLS